MQRLWPRWLDGVGVTCGCCVNRAELQLAVIRHHLYSLSTLGLARVCRPAADIADPEPGTEDGEWRLVAVTITTLGTLALGLWDPMSKGFV